MKHIILVFIGLVGVITIPSFNAATVEEPEQQNIIVSAGACHNMKRDTKYSTPDYQSGSNGYVYNTTHSCENQNVADGYTGTADLYVEKANGSNVVHDQMYFSAGATHTISKTSDPYAFFHSSVSWEIIQDESTSGSKVIYASVK